MFLKNNTTYVYLWLIHIHVGRNQQNSVKQLCVLLAHVCPTLCNPMGYIAHQATLSMRYLQLKNK